MHATSSRSPGTICCPHFSCSSQLDPDVVRNNSVFDLGELALYGGPAMHAHFPQILQNLSQLMTHKSAPSVQDQIVGSMCRLILANKELVPLQDVLPVVLNKLPLREDFDEYLPVYQMIRLLYVDGVALIKNAMQMIVQFSVQVYNSTVEYRKDKVLPEMKYVLCLFAQEFPTDFRALIAAFPQEQVVTIARELNIQ